MQAMFAVCKFLHGSGVDVFCAASADAADDLSHLLQDFGMVQHRLFRRSFPARYSNSAELATWLKKSLVNFDLVEIHAVFSLLSWRTARMCRRLNVPYVIRPHSSLDPYDLRKHAGLKRVVGPLFVKRMLRESCGVLLTAPLEAERLKTYGAAVKKFIVPLPVVFPDTTGSRSNFRSRYSIPSDAKVVLFLSRIDPKKGLDLLIPALGQLKNRFPKLWFVLAGTGSTTYSAVVQRALIDCGVAAFTTQIGFAAGQDKLDAFAGSDIFALPSYNENFGIAVAEAMNAGLPVLVSDEVYIWPDVHQARAGAICKPEISSVIAILGQMLDGTIDLAASGKRGREMARMRYSAESTTAALMDVYRHIGASGGRYNRASVREDEATSSPGGEVVPRFRLWDLLRYPQAWYPMLCGVVPAIEHRDVIHAFECDMLIDVAAGKGEFSLIFRLMHPDVAIHAFESRERDAAMYRRAIAGEHGVTLHSVDFAAPTSAGLSQHGHKHQFGDPVGGCLKLDEFARHWRVARRAVLKVFGGPRLPLILEGAALLLEHCCYVYVVGMCADAQGENYSLENVVKLLSKYSLVPTHRENEKWVNDRLVCADYLFTRVIVKEARRSRIEQPDDNMSLKDSKTAS